MQLYTVVLFSVVCFAYSELKDVKRGKMNKLHFTRTRPARVSHRAHSLVLDDVANSTSSSNPTSVPEVDGAQMVWVTSPWSECSVECGLGDMERVVNCMNNDTQTVESDAVCLADQFVLPPVRPDSSSECNGTCVTCSDHTDLFVSIGLLPPPEKPVYSRSSKVCSVNDSIYSCCDSAVESSIVTQVIAIQKGFATIPKAASDQVDATIESITNSTADFQARLTETTAQLSAVQSVLSRPTNLKVDKNVYRALNIVSEVLSDRIDHLNQAIANSTAIIALVKGQLAVLMTDTSMDNKTLSAGYNVSQSAGRTPDLSACLDATVGLFASMSCSACQPVFVSDNVFQADASPTSAIAVSNNVCTSVYKECSPTIRNSRKFLRQALSVMRKIHSNLAKAATRLQPALLELWATLTFDWLPGSTRPLSASGAASTFVPDLSSLDCIRNDAPFILPSTTQVGEFCENFFGNWNYQFTIQNILKDLKRGTSTYLVLNRCDKCLHTIAMKLGNLLTNSKGGIDVTLALSPEALADSGCVGLSSTPAKVPQTTNPTSPTTNTFFAISESDSAWTSTEFGEISRKSKRAFSMIMNRRRDNLNSNDTDALSMQSPVPFIHSIVYTDDGIDPGSVSSVSWETVNSATQNPPPSQWDVRLSSEVGIIASDLNCTSHTACNPESGDAPFWFCAKVSVCNGPVPCDDNELAMLTVHPRCVKGLCVDHTTAVDGKCPDIAVCPSTIQGQFDHTYFAKFKNIAPQLPPSDALVAAEGADVAAGITQAQSYSAGVCDCAFAQKGDQNGQPTLVVADDCVYAQCLAYAQFNEASVNCVTSLNSMCTSFQSACPDLVCDKIGAQWNPPICEAKAGVSGGFAMASDIKGSMQMNAIFAVASIVAFWI